MDPVIRCTTLPSHSRSLKGFLFHFLRSSIHFYRLSHFELGDIEKEAVCSGLQLLKTKNALLKSILQAGNPVKEILLKLNLPDHRSILADSKVHIKMVMEIPDSSCWFKKNQKLKNAPKAKGVAPKAKGISIKEPSESHKAELPKKNLDKGKDEEEARRLQAIFDEEARLAKEEADKEAQLVEDWDNVKAKVDTDYELASKLQAEEQEELTIEEKSKLFVELMEKRKRHFAAKRAEEKRNKPPTKAQKRKTMSPYLKNMDGMDTTEEAKKLGGISKRASDEPERKSKKKPKMDDEELAKLQALIEITPPEEEVPINAIPLAMKPPAIVDYGIHKEGMVGFYKITRADGLDTIFRVFSVLLYIFDREDLETLWKLVKAKHGDQRPEEEFEKMLWGDLKTMFEPNVEDLIWREIRQGTILIWKLFSSCGVHLVRFSNVQVYMLVERRYPLTKPILTDMLDKKLKVDYYNEMAYQLLKLIERHLNA
ncbi:hypothetical protein Tco_0194835 [Tanacetum coccineum]